MPLGRSVRFLRQAVVASDLAIRSPSNSSSFVLRFAKRCPTWTRIVCVTVSPSPQSKDEENEKLHELRRYTRDFRHQHTTDAEQFDWDSDDGDYGLAIGRLVIT
jgi:hypothetical protein